MLLPVVPPEGWDNFANTLGSDLALLTLFAEQVTKQYLSESLSWVDCLLFALSPLGIPLQHLWLRFGLLGARGWNVKTGRSLDILQDMWDPIPRYFRPGIITLVYLLLPQITASYSPESLPRWCLLNFNPCPSLPNSIPSTHLLLDNPT